MSDETLEAYICQLLESHRTPSVTVAWQGGEPTLMKVEFFRRSIELVEKYRRPGQTIQHTFQTNGILLDDEWCAFFKEHNFLVGLSVDGPRELHNTYRRDRAKQGTFDKVMRGWRHLKKHDVDFNILCTVNSANQKHGRTVYRFFRDELGAKWVQFIPIVERASPETIQIANLGWSETPGSKRLLYTQSGNLVTNRSVGGKQYGQFLVDVFEEWVRRDVGEVFVQMFDVTLEAYLAVTFFAFTRQRVDTVPRLNTTAISTHAITLLSLVFSWAIFTRPIFCNLSRHPHSANSEMTSAIRLLRNASAVR